MERRHLTISFLKSLSVGKVAKYGDTEVRNLQVWVGKQTITFYLGRKFENRQHWISLGRWPDMTLDQARQSALKKLGAMVNHRDPDLPDGSTVPTVADAMEYYITTHHSRHAQVMARGAFRYFAELRNLRLTAVTREDIRKVHSKMKDKPQMANQAVKRLSAAMNQIMKKMDRDFINPCRGIEFYEYKPRERYLTPEEAPKFIEAVRSLQNSKYSAEADAILMLMMTGARKQNVCTMMLEEISDQGIWTIPKEKFKGGRTSHQIALGEREMAIIEKRRKGRKTGPVFTHRKNRPISDVKHVVQMACLASGIRDFHPHDLRRTLATWMLSTGADIATVSKKLGHSSIRITELVYAHVLPSVSLKATDKAIDAMLSKTESPR